MGGAEVAPVVSGAVGDVRSETFCWIGGWLLEGEVAPKVINGTIVGGRVGRVSLSTLSRS